MEGSRKSDPAVRRSRWDERDLSCWWALSVACPWSWDPCVGGRIGVVEAVAAERQLLLLHMVEMCVRACLCVIELVG